MAIYYFDPDGGNNANDGLSFANRKKDWTSMPTTAVDEYRVMGARDPHTLGNADWTNGSNVVTLAAAKAVTVDNCDAAWTASTNVTATTTASAIARVWRQGTGVARAQILAAFTTGIVAYKALGATLDLSAYRGLSLSMGTSIAVASGVLRLDLCSDAAGAVPVASMLLPAFAANGGRNVFVDFGAALPSNVNSIALYAVSDPGTVNVDMDNIVAVHELGHADHICHNSLIGKETVGEPELWPVKSIDGAAITIGSFETTGGTTGRLYAGATETVTTYCQQTQVLEATPTGGQDTGVHPMTGGWNRTDMSTRGTRDTFLAGQRHCAYAYQRTAASIDMDGFSFTGFTSGIAQYGTFAGDIRVKGKHCSGMGSVIPDLQAYSSIKLDYMVMNQQFGTAGTVNPEYVTCNIVSKLWGECNNSFWLASFVNGMYGFEQVQVELGKVRNCARGYDCANYSGSVNSIPLKNTLLSGQGNAQEYNNRYSYNFENVSFTRTTGAYWYNTASKLIFTKKDGNANLCGWATNNTVLELQADIAPPTGDTVSWRFRCSRNISGGKYPRAPFMSFGAEAGKTYTVDFDGRRASASNGYIGRLEAEDAAGTIVGYDDIDGAAGSWVAGTFTFLAAVSGPVTLFLAKPVDVGSNDHNCYAANIKITEA